jgi:concentrative nucleoside transporter, CNT family
MALNPQNLLGVAKLLLIDLLFSANRRDRRWRIVIAALSTQIGIGALFLFMPFGKAILADMAAGVNRILITAVPVSRFCSTVRCFLL